MCTNNNNNNNNFRVSNIRVSNRALIYNVCPEAALTWPSRHSRHRHLCSTVTLSWWPIAEALGSAKNCYNFYYYLLIFIRELAVIPLSATEFYELFVFFCYYSWINVMVIRDYTGSCLKEVIIIMNCCSWSMQLFMNFYCLIINYY